MAALTDAERLEIAVRLARKIYGELTATANCGSDDLKAAADAADSWADANAASYNAALPLTFRTNATLQQKTALLMFVITKRAGFDP